MSEQEKEEMRKLLDEVDNKPAGNNDMGLEKIFDDEFKSTTKKIKMKIKKQKIFIICSILFLVICVLIYGGRFTYFYLDNEKTIEKEKNSIATALKTKNNGSENFKKIGEDYYFYKDTKNNYLLYSNIMWRIIKVNGNKSVTLIMEDPITVLAYGDKKLDYDKSMIYSWLNNEKNGLMLKLNSVQDYLTQNKVCADVVDKLSERVCDNVLGGYLDLLSIDDYINTGNTDSFINNGYYSYLVNKNSENGIWYLNKDGKIAIAEGSELYGIRPVITLNANLEFKDGEGSLEKPYILSEDPTYFGSYVKLDDDVYRVYDETNGVLKLSMITPIADEEKVIRHIYSSNNDVFDSTRFNSLANYLNKDYIKGLDYQKIIVENTYSNGYYADNYDYTNAFSTSEEVDVAVPSIGDALFKTDANEFFTATGIGKKSAYVYVVRKGMVGSFKAVKFSSEIIPCISIKKESLKAGTGTEKDPFRVE